MGVDELSVECVPLVEDAALVLLEPELTDVLDDTPVEDEDHPSDEEPLTEVELSEAEPDDCLVEDTPLDCAEDWDEELFTPTQQIAAQCVASAASHIAADQSADFRAASPAHGCCDCNGCSQNCPHVMAVEAPEVDPTVELSTLLDEDSEPPV